MTTDAYSHENFDTVETYDLPPLPSDMATGEGIIAGARDYTDIDASFKQVDTEFAASQAESAEYADIAAERMSIRDRIGSLATKGQVMWEGARERFDNFTEAHPGLATAGGALVDAAVGLASDAARKRFDSDDVRAASDDGADAAIHWTNRSEAYIAERNHTKAQQRGVGHLALRHAMQTAAVAGAKYAMKRL
jgi:hypothetical protein